MKLTSFSFADGANLPQKYTCDGQSVNPPLSFVDIPAHTTSFALVVEDTDVPRHIREDGMWYHWLVWNIPPETTKIEEGIPPAGVFGINSGRTLGYTPPCPPNGTHRYYFKLFALSQMLDLPEGATKQELLSAMEGKILGQAELMGTYCRQ
jgi:hypothetical protein